MPGMCTVQISPGRGGQDAERFAASLAGAVRAWAARNRRPVSVAGATRAVTVSLPRTRAGALR
jgi:protein subunit release factor B